MEKIFNWFLPIKSSDGRVLRGVVQYETAPIVRIHLCDDDGRAVNLSGCGKVLLSLEKPDGGTYTEILDIYDKERGIIDISLCEHKTDTIGLYEATLNVFSVSDSGADDASDGTQESAEGDIAEYNCASSWTGLWFTSARFRYFVEPAINVENPVSGEVVYPTLLELVAGVTALEAEIQEAESARAVYEAFETGKAYEPGNKVTYDGSSYLLINQPEDGEYPFPTDTNYWLLIAAKGETGEKGKDGETPERGEDYWTAEDIEEIKGYVDEAILNGSW